ncbi:MAG TPA: 4-hydroxy-tetrahydrodipicolinate synthase [Sphingobacteriaceae bacterium]|nr:4-hydroxy-tetrahydrodipicolinate synthase [Sphingobacteriaceae bacterium]
MNSFYGAGVALITPFNDDLSIDYTSLGKLIEYQLAGGMDYLVSLGTTGETATLSLDEKKQVWKFTAEKVAGRVPLIAGIGGNNTREIIHEMNNLDIEGYSAILSVSPYYNKPTQEGLYQHYKAIAESAPLPIILYNVPGRTGSNLAVETVLRLAHDFDNIIGVKEASGSFDQFNKIMRDKPDSFLLISGDDPVTLPMMALGAVGIISVVGNAFPKEVSRLAQLCFDQNFKEAQKFHSQLLKITELCFREGNPAGVKAILKEIGIGKDNLRLPLTRVSDNTRELIKEELKSAMALNA